VGRTVRDNVDVFASDQVAAIFDRKTSECTHAKDLKPEKADAIEVNKYIQTTKKQIRHGSLHIAYASDIIETLRAPTTVSNPAYVTEPSNFKTSASMSALSW